MGIGGLLPSQVWDMTFAEVQLVIAARRNLRDAENEWYNYRAGLLCSTIAQFSGMKKQGGGDWKPTDFIHLPSLEKPKKEQRPMTDEEMIETVKRANLALGGDVK